MKKLNQKEEQFALMSSELEQLKSSLTGKLGMKWNVLEMHQPSCSFSAALLSSWWVLSPARPAGLFLHCFLPLRQQNLYQHLMAWGESLLKQRARDQPLLTVSEESLTFCCSYQFNQSTVFILKGWSVRSGAISIAGFSSLQFSSCSLHTLPLKCTA